MTQAMERPEGPRWFNLGGAVGLVVVLVVVSGVVRNSAASWSEALLVAGSAAIAPFVLRRIQWRSLGRPRIVVLAAAWGFVLWAVLSTLAHLGDAPWQQYVYGWYGRWTGVLAYAAAALLLTAAMVLVRPEALAVCYLIVLASVLSAIAAIVQALSHVPGEAVSGLVGNPDFNGVLCGLGAGLAVLLGMRMWLRPRWRVSGPVVVATVCLVGVALSNSWQGYAVAVIALSAGLVVQSVVRKWWIPLGVSAAVLLGVVVLVALVFTRVVDLPGAAVDARLVYWQTALTTMWHQPLFGFGPDSFAEAVAQYRPLGYVDIRDPAHHVSAAHSVPLQLGATLGVPALVLWCVIGGVTLVVIIRALLRREGIGEVLAVAVGGWVAYVAQSFISIDQLALLAIGWVLTGLAIAAAEPLEGNAAPRVGPWRVASSCVAGVVAVVVMAPEIAAVDSALHASTPADERTALASPWTPCALRADLAQTAFATSAIAEAYAIDPLCPGVGDAYASALLDDGDNSSARSTALAVVEHDPLDASAWILLGIADARLGDLDGAKAAQAQALDIAGHGWIRTYQAQLRLLGREIRAAESAA